ncbi:hypothetical protein D3C76_348660 [compost metagenome]
MIILLYITNTIISIIFFLSFSMKAHNLYNFKLEISTYGILPHRLIGTASYMVIITEAFIVISYLFDWFSGWRQFFCVCMLIIFSIATWIKNRNTQQKSCSCFGSIFILNRFPQLRNIVLISLVLLSYYLPKTTFTFFESIQWTLFICWISLLIEILSTRERRETKSVG